MRLKNILNGTMKIRLRQNLTEYLPLCTDYIPLKILLNYSVFTGSGQGVLFAMFFLIVFTYFSFDILLAFKY